MVFPKNKWGKLYDYLYIIAHIVIRTKSILPREDYSNYMTLK